MLNRRQFVAGSLLMPIMPMALSLTTTSAPAKILLDTDIGSDIDDAVALAYLLRKPQCELLGITTVTGSTESRAHLAFELCHAAGQDIPIYPGIENPLIIPQKQTQVPQAEKLQSKMPQLPDGNAIEFMRTEIRRYPGEVTLLTVGPLTNVAVLFQTDPEIPQLLKQLVMMGGKYSDHPTPWGPTEWNAIVDPHATAIVFGSAVPQIIAYGLDITWQVSMTPAEVSKKFKGDKLLEIVHSWSEVWFREREILHFHDPLAAAAIFNPDLCTYKTGTVNVELEAGPTQGVTHFQPNAQSPFLFAKSVNADAFFSEYFGAFDAAGLES